MNSKKIGDNSNKLSKGYVISNKLISDNQLNKKFKKTEKKYSDKSYPNGVIPFIFLLLFYIIFTIVVIAIGFNEKKNIFIYQWYWSTLSTASCYLLMNILWLIGRTGFSSSFGYCMLKVSRFIRTRKLRQKIEFYIDNEPAINEVNTNQEFIEYCNTRKQYTKKFCYISLSLSAIVFIINIIVSFSYYYTVIV